MRKIAISDIHGCALTFRKLLIEVVRFSKEDELYLLGDYVDRGPGSKQVFDFIFNLQNEGYRVHCLMGNHEEAMLACIQGTGHLASWKRYGGQITLDSFGVSQPDDIAKDYLDFLQNLELYFEVDDYILVHAGLNFRAKNPLLDKVGMLWSRDWESTVNKNWLDGRSVIYGHTPVKYHEIEFALSNLSESKLLNIDAGCYGSYSPEYGSLCAFDLTNQQLYFQKNIDNMQAWRTQIGK